MPVKVFFLLIALLCGNLNGADTSQSSPVYSNYCYSLFAVQNTDYQELIGELQQRPRREIEKDPISMKATSNHPVFISMTTSPKRIRRIHNVLRTLDLSLVRNVLLVLPRRFGRTGERYEVPPHIETNPKIKIIVIEEDMGPISKMLPAIEYANTLDPDSLVISIDDDVGYPRGMVGEMIYHMSRTRMTVFGGSIPQIGSWGVDQALWPFANDLGEIVEGWAAIGYRAGEINTELLRQLSQLSRATFASDDVAISYALSARGIKKRLIHNEFFKHDYVRPFPYGFHEDALHRGAGLGASQVGIGDYNPIKYRQSLSDMNRAMYPDRTYP